MSIIYLFMSVFPERETNLYFSRILDSSMRSDSFFDQKLLNAVRKNFCDDCIYIYRWVLSSSYYFTIDRQLVFYLSAITRSNHAPVNTIDRSYYKKRIPWCSQRGDAISFFSFLFQGCMSQGCIDCLMNWQGKDLNEQTASVIHSRVN